MGQRPDEIASPGRSAHGGSPADRAATSEHQPGVSGGDSPEEIRREMEHTRAELSETIDAIQEKLNPDVLKDQAKAAVREATIGRAEGAMSNMVNRVEEMADMAGETAMETGSDVVETVKQNPIPALLAGVGLGWLFMNRTPSRSSHGDYRRSTSYPSGYPYEGRTGPRPVEGMAARSGVPDRYGREMPGRSRSGIMDTVRGNPLPSALLGVGLGWLLVNRSSGSDRGTYGYGAGSGSYRGAYEGYYEERGGIDQVRERAGEAAGRVQQTVGDAAGRTQEAVGEVADRAQETVGDITGQAQETIGHAVDEVQETAGRFVRQTQYRATRLEDQVQEMLRTNPLAVGGAALAIGAVVGLMLPETRREQEVMGEARDNLMQQVRTTTEETIEKVQRVAEEVQHTVEEETREQGLG